MTRPTLSPNLKTRERRAMMNKTSQERPKKPKYEVADIVSIFALDRENMIGLTVTQRRILENILFCRTAGMGGHVSQCDECRHIEISYNSCRDRHCPKCQSLAKARWLDARKNDLLPVRYCHTVFTLPHELNDLILYNKKLTLDGLFDVVNQTLIEFSKNPRYGLVGQLGFSLVLHTWDQRMNSHYHLHCIIPSGVYIPDGGWVDVKYKFLFPVQALSKVFKGKYVSFLRKAYKKGKLGFSGSIASLGKGKAFSDLLSAVMAKEWIVYVKSPFQSPSKVLDYLGQYTHKVAIGNHRITGISKKEVTFTYKKRNFKGTRYSYEIRTCHLSPEKFVRRFLLHELPSGFTRIRHYGFLGNNAKGKRLNQIRKAIGFPEKKERSTLRKKDTRRLMLELTGIDISLCPKCKVGKLRKIDEFDGVYRKAG
jgi:hypothetical protein